MRRSVFVAAVQLTMAILILAISGCSSGPSTSAAEEFAREQIKKQSQDRIKLVGFSKIDGQESAPNGIPSYKLDYEAELEFLENCRWGTKHGVNGGWNGDYRCVPIIEGPGYSGDIFTPFGEAKKGTRTKVRNFVTFEKSEAGWRPQEPRLPLF